MEGDHESECRPVESRMTAHHSGRGSRQLGLLGLVERRGLGQRQKFLPASLQNRYSLKPGEWREHDVRRGEGLG